MSDSESEREEESSLYNPPADEGETVDPEAAEKHEVLHLDIPKELARQLLDVATHLGLSPSLVASRAIDLVCDEVDIEEESPPPPARSSSSTRPVWTYCTPLRRKDVPQRKRWNQRRTTIPGQP